MSLRSKVKEAMVKAATQGDCPATATAISKEDWNAGTCCTPVVLVAKVALAVIDNEVGDESATPIDSFRRALDKEVRRKKVGQRTRLLRAAGEAVIVMESGYAYAGKEFGAKCEALREAIRQESGVPFCPDCYASMVKTRVQNEEGDWAAHWLCECKVEPLAEAVDE